MYCYYMMEQLLKYTAGDVFWDTIIASNAEAIGYVVSGYLYVRFEGGKIVVTASMLAGGLLALIAFIAHPSGQMSGFFSGLLLVLI